MKLTSHILFCLLVLISLASSVSAQNNPRPQWLKPGLRIIYFEGQARVSNALVKVTFDQNGNPIVDGQPYSLNATTGAGGGGYSVVEIGGVDPQAIACVVSMYIFNDATLKNVVPVETLPPRGFAVPQLVSNDYWRDPAELAKIPNGQQAAGVFVVRMKYPVAHMEFDAIRIITNSNNMASAATYDLATGILLNSSYSGQSMNVLAQGQTGGVAQTGTTLTTSRLMSVRDSNLPWEEMPAPDWVARVRAITYNFDIRSFIPNALDAHRPGVAVARITGHGPTWLSYDIFAQGQETGQPLGQMVAGSANHLGLFIPPQIIPQLRPGQVLDQDETLNIQWVVSQANGQGVVISEIGGGYRIDATYDHTGMLIDHVLTRQDGVCTTTVRTSLAGAQ